MPDIERRAITTPTLRAKGTGRRVTGRAIVYDSLSEDLGGFRERIAPGALVEALPRSDVRALFNHDPNHVLGRQRARTLALRDTAAGLDVEIDVPETTVGETVLEGIRRGDIDGMSFAFTVADGGDRWSQGPDGLIRTVTKLEELYDVSVVTYTAYEATTVSARCRNQVQAGVDRPANPPGKATPTPSRRLTAAQRTAVAWHEAAHVVVALVQRLGIRCAQVYGARKDDGTLGCVRTSTQTLELFMAGQAAGDLRRYRFDVTDRLCGFDMEEAARYADRHYPAYERQAIDDAHRVATCILSRNRGLWSRLAAELDARGSLAAAEIRRWASEPHLRPRAA